MSRRSHTSQCSPLAQQSRVSDRDAQRVTFDDLVTARCPLCRAPLVARMNRFGPYFHCQCPARSAAARRAAALSANVPAGALEMVLERAGVSPSVRGKESRRRNPTRSRTRVRA